MKPTKIDVSETSAELVAELAKPRDEKLHLPMHTIRASMSSAERLIDCQWWLGKKAPRRIVGEPAHYGTAFHFMAAGFLTNDNDAQQKGVDYATAHGLGWREIQDHAYAANKTLVSWLKQDNPYDVDFFSKGRELHVEQSFALQMLATSQRGRARLCKAPTEDTHEYLDVDHKHELPGTADVVITPPGANAKQKSTLLVLDHKTGEGPYFPEDEWQLKALALAACAVYDCGAAIVAIHHTPRLTKVSSVYAARLTTQDLLASYKRLKTAWFADRSFTRPNGGCGYCAALTVCPSYSLAAIGKTTQLTTPEEVGRIHQQLAVYDDLRERLRDEIKAFVERNPNVAVTRPDGKILAFKESKRRDITLSAIKRVHGEVEGEKIIADLERKGYVTNSPRRELRADVDKAWK